MKTNTSLISSVLLGAFWLLLMMPTQAQVLLHDSSASPVHLRAWARVVDSTPDSIPSIVNDGLHNFHHNNHFRTAIPINVPDAQYTIWYDTTGLSKLVIGSRPPLGMKDFVFFNPAAYFHDPVRVEMVQNDMSSTFRRGKKRYLSEAIVTPPPIPYALRYYLDTNHLSVESGQTRLYLLHEANLLPEPFLKPFWFRRYLVSNAEYREFVRYVTDSIARTILFNAGQKQYGRMVTHTDAHGKEIQVLLLDYAPPIYWDEEQIETLVAGMFRPEHERYYRRKQINAAILNYESPTFCPPVAPLNIYPDTSAWIMDFPEGYMEPWERNYFWHPVYDHYPVVGVNYWQVLAYLDWKTRQLQQELDRKGIRIRVVCDLPTEAEWEMVSTADRKDGKPELYPRHYPELADQSWITNLQLTQDKIVQIDSTDKTLWQVNYRHNLLTEAIEGSDRSRVRRHVDESIFPHSTGQYEKKKNWSKSQSPLCSPDPNGIFHMGGNVSEWLKDTYREQWLPVFTKRQEMLSRFSDPEMVLLSQLEQYYNTQNDTNGRLVRGANWYDRRYSMLYGKNYSGMQAKRFVSPDNAHPTLGFRYIIRFEEY